MDQIPIPTLVLITRIPLPSQVPISLPPQHQISANLSVACSTNTFDGQSCKLNQGRSGLLGGVEWNLAGIPIGEVCRSILTEIIENEGNGKKSRLRLD